MFRERAVVTGNRNVAPGHFVMRFKAPKIGRGARPGQFVQITCSESTEPLLPRPFSFLDADASGFSVLYHVVGQGTSLLSRVRAGDDLWVLGPLGNGFSAPSAAGTRYLLVGGGVGIPPLFHWARVAFQKKRLAKTRARVFLGARGKSLLLCEKEFRRIGAELSISTDDGSRGRREFVTAALERELRASNPEEVRILACGPTPMLRAVTALARQYGCACEVSVEVPMACGFGACLGCAVRVKDGADSKERFAMACTEGPVFEAEALQWE